ncbi:universal stress protein [Lewinella sp. LCG006]|uniref:universal stress protein n=1 Tax=Lewinella sp. LCG006 TaxID=3231911 RepID=UPI00345FCCFC
MKILCPTDFSAVANYAFDAACLLAKKLKAELHLFHNISGSAAFTSAFDDETYAPYQHAVVAAAEEQLALLKKEGNARKVAIDIHLSSGDFLTNIQELIAQTPFDFVVMGSHGASGKREWLIGSNAQKVVRRIHTNILIIKEPLTELRLEKAVFATGLLPDDQKAFRNFLDLTAILQIKEVHLLSIHTSGIFNPPQIVMQEALKDFAAIAEGYTCKTHYYEDISVEAGIRHFTQEQRMDLIAIANHPRHPLRRIFSGNTVEMVVNHAEVPVWSVDYA